MCTSDATTATRRSCFGIRLRSPRGPGTPDLLELDALNEWWNSTYHGQGASVSAYEHRAGELIMGTNPDVVLPSNHYRRMSGRDDKDGKYMLRDLDAAVGWVAEYLDRFFRGPGNLNAQLRPMYREVTNEPDMILNARDKFFLSSWESLFEYHNFVADKVRSRLGDRAPLIGGIVTGIDPGFTTVTARTVDGEFEDTVKISVTTLHVKEMSIAPEVAVIEVSPADAEPCFVDAEKFQATGGTFQGFKTTEDQRQTNYNQTGDWAEYKVHFPEKGTYQILLDAGTPLDGAGVEVFINGTSAGSKPLPNTGNWGRMQRTTVSNGLSIPKVGHYTIRLLSVGNPNAWQWNADKLGFRKLTSRVKQSDALPRRRIARRTEKTEHRWRQHIARLRGQTSRKKGSTLLASSRFATGRSSGYLHRRLKTGR